MRPPTPPPPPRFVPPSARADTIRDRHINACAAERRRAHPSNTSRSAADNSISTALGARTNPCLARPARRRMSCTAMSLANSCPLQYDA